ncbi:MAG: sodium:proton antiporter [Phycisphaerae bacterium]|jgi:CPA1 family monovalent cation:H+ antiporter|nr:sodium:proton antiporter [Phycisphaerae bacterium]
MDVFETVAILLTLAAVLSYVNHRWWKMPPTIALMLGSLVLSLVLLGVGALPVGQGIQPAARGLVEDMNFGEVMMKGMLGLLLFAGSLHVQLNDLAEYKWQIATYAIVGTVASTFLVAGLVFGLSGVMSLGIPWIYCLLFGALISPTDPIAVLGIMKRVGASRSLETKISGESLFNDGIGVVVFISVMEVAMGEEAGIGWIAKLFLIEAVGGIAFGLVIGYLTFRIIKSIDNYHVEILVTLALVMGGYALAYRLRTSGPLAMVAAGLLMGNTGRRLGMSRITREHLDLFWELIDQILNAILFVMIGLEVLVLSARGMYMLAGLIAVPLVLLSRMLTVGAGVMAVGTGRPKTVAIMTWGGLRGGISVALALSIPQSVPCRELIVTMTYVVVAFAVLVQGMTVGRLIRAWGGEQITGSEK